MSFHRNLLALSSAAMAVGTTAAYAAAEAYATDAATYISGDGKLTVLAVLTATASVVVVIWIARKLGLR